jgi:hypothetical protein
MVEFFHLKIILLSVFLNNPKRQQQQQQQQQLHYNGVDTMLF